MLRGPGSLCYSLFLGQGRIGRWALPDIVRQWGSVAFALPGYWLGGLRGAVCGYLVSETVIFVVAVTGARRAFSWSAFRFNLRASRPLLGMGLAFYASEMVASAIERSGAVLIRSVTLDYAQVGLFGVSYQIFMAALLSTGQITNSFVPLLTVLRARGETAEMRAWVERLVKWLAITGMLGLLGSLILGRDLVPFVLGREYGVVYPNVVVMSAALLFLPLTHTCSLLALVHDRPGVLFRAALLKLVCFWALGIPLVVRWGSLGACLAMGAAIATQAVYLLIRHAALVGPALRRWSFVVGTGLLLAPLAWLRGTLPLNIALFVLATAVWLLILRRSGVISARELRAIYQALGSGDIRSTAP
jgi:O-antigen/teichoic acid export membrane protein